jgi:zinc protease
LADSPTHFEALSNGLTLLLRELHVSPVAELQIWAKVGSADERPGEQGLAHFHEHMLFKGTERRGVGAVAGEIEGVGGRVNAYTSYDVTVYHATVPSNGLPVALDVLSDAIRFSVFEPSEIAREIEVVLEEIRRGEDSPSQVLGNAVFAHSYRLHPYRAPILGTSESVAGFDRRRVRAFFERWYAPDNLVVVAAGDFDTRELREGIAAAFEGSHPARTPRARVAEPPRTELRGSVVRRPFERASFELTYGVPNFRDPDAPLLDLLAFVLGEGESSRLVRRVKEQAGLADRVDASAYTPLDPGLFGASAELEPTHADDCIAAVAAEVERLRAEPVTQDELERARANFLATEYFERESVSGIARKLGSFQVLGGDWRSEERYLATVRAATRADLQRVAHDYFAHEAMTATLLYPSRVRVAPDEERVVAAVLRGVEHTRRAFAAPIALPISGRGTAPAADAARGVESAGALHSYRLPNGAALHVLPRREVPVVAVRAAFLGGLLAESEQNSGLTSFLTSMWMRGTRARSAADFARAVESLAADIDGFAGRSSLGLTLETPTPQLAPALDLFAEVLLEPGFDPTELGREKRDTLAALARREDRVAERAFDLFTQTLFERHPYRLPLIGTKRSVRAFRVEALEAHHARLVRAPNLVLAVAGDVDPDAIAARLSALLADLDGGEFEAPSPAPEPPLHAIRIAELRKRRAQAHLVLGFRGLDVRDDDRFALELVAQILAGQGGRLFLELRDRQSLAYSVSAVNVEGVAPGFFAVYIGTAPEKLDLAREGILLELRKLVESPPADEELRRAQNYLTGNFAIDQQRSAVRAGQIALDALYGLGADASTRYVERVLSIGKDDVLRVARRVLDLDAYALAMVRP